MNKKEKELLEAALTAAALRVTADVETDVPPPSCGESGMRLSTGWMYIGERSDYAKVEPACSSAVYHGIGHTDKTTTQRPIHLYSTKLLALKALRREVEKDCAKRLRKVDRMIEEESRN